MRLLVILQPLLFFLLFHTLMSTVELLQCHYAWLLILYRRYFKWVNYTSNVSQIWDRRSIMFKLCDGNMFQSDVVLLVCMILKWQGLQEIFKGKFSKAIEMFLIFQFIIDAKARQLEIIKVGRKIHSFYGHYTSEISPSLNIAINYCCRFELWIYSILFALCCIFLFVSLISFYPFVYTPSCLPPSWPLISAHGA